MKIIIVDKITPILCQLSSIKIHNTSLVVENSYYRYHRYS